MPREKRIVFVVLGMSCIQCASMIEKVLKDKHGIHHVSVNYMTDTTYVDYDPDAVSPEQIEETLKKTRYKFIRRRDLER